MKTAPPSRNRRANPSRPRSFAARSSGGAGDPGGAQPAAPTSNAHPPGDPAGASGGRSTGPGVQVPEAAAARHSAEAAGIESAPLAPGRAGFLRSFVYAWNGIVYTVRTQRNMRIHITLAVLAIALGIWLRISPVEFAMVFVAITGVVVSEMINTVAEACVDLVTQEYHPLARVAKDVAAGAVLLSAMLAVVIACFVYIPHLWPLALQVLGR